MVAGHPRLFWAGIFGFLGWRIPAAVDAYRVVRSSREHARWATLVRAWLVLTIGALVVAKGVIRPFFAETFQIPSKAMVPTLVVGDHIVVDKLRRAPQRGDVVVFKYPLDETVDYVKRVIGLPGDVVEVSRGRVSVNGEALPRETFEEDCPQGPDGMTQFEEAIPCVLWNETAAGRTYEIGTDTILGEKHDFDRRVVPRDAVFVLGDNRDNSSDSRVWGTVPLENIQGIVRFIFWSASGEGLSLRGLRWERLDKPVR